MILSEIHTHVHCLRQCCGKIVGGDSTPPPPPVILLGANVVPDDAEADVVDLVDEPVDILLILIDLS